MDPKHDLYLLSRVPPVFSQIRQQILSGIQWVQLVRMGCLVDDTSPRLRLFSLGAVFWRDGTETGVLEYHREIRAGRYSVSRCCNFDFFVVDDDEVGARWHAAASGRLGRTLRRRRPRVLLQPAEDRPLDGIVHVGQVVLGYDDDAVVAAQSSQFAVEATRCLLGRRLERCARRSGRLVRLLLQELVDDVFDGGQRQCHRERVAAEDAQLASLVRREHDGRLRLLLQLHEHGRVDENIVYLRRVVHGDALCRRHQRLHVALKATKVLSTRNIPNKVGSLMLGKF